MKIRVINNLLIKLGISHAVDVYYDCYRLRQYLTVTIQKYPFGAKLKIGNVSPEINEWGNSCGTIVSQDSLYGYIAFDYGYLFFGGSALREYKFGYSLWKSKREKDSNSVSTFATYIDVDIEKLEKIIKLLKQGEI